MTDIVKRLRLDARGPNINIEYYFKDAKEAADEIERLLKVEELAEQFVDSQTPENEIALRSVLNTE